VLGKISIKSFEPKTAKPGEEVDRKIALRDFILKNPKNLDEVRGAKKSCTGIEKFSVNVVFSLNRTDKKNSSKYDKDLDNLLKVVLDVLPDYMDNKQEDRNPGLGIIRNDSQIYEIHSVKKFENYDEDKVGIDIAFSEYVE